MEEGETKVPLYYTGMLGVGGKGEGERNGEVINAWCISKYIHLHHKAYTHTYILNK